MGKVIVGGLIGVVLCAAVWLGLEHTLNRNLNWMVVVVGLGAGLGVRLASTPETRSPATGALAVLLAIVGVLGGNLTKAAALKSLGGANTAMVNSDRQDADDEAEDSAEPDEDDQQSSTDARDEDAESESSESADALADAKKADAERAGTEDADAEEEMIELPPGFDPLNPDAPKRIPKTARKDLVLDIVGCLLAYLGGSGRGKAATGPEPESPTTT